MLCQYQFGVVCVDGYWCKVGVGYWEDLGDGLVLFDGIVQIDQKFDQFVIFGKGEVIGIGYIQLLCWLSCDLFV